MVNFHGTEKEDTFFEGWYFKQQKGDRTLALIPGYRIDGRGRRSAFLQLITEKGSWQADYPASEFQAARNQLAVRVGKNLFTPLGLRIEVQNGLFSCRGSVNFGRLAPPRYGAMGPFGLLSSLPCNHGVISLCHSLSGTLNVNGEAYCFDGGRGYIEKDWGSSFPKRYLWVQSNQLKNPAQSVMAAVADVPFLKTSFRGVICMVLFQGREYRLATYTGARILSSGPQGVSLAQGGLRLDIFFESSDPKKLLAPVEGLMNRTILEHPASKVRFRFLQNGRVLFDQTSPHASYEYVEDSL